MIALLALKNQRLRLAEGCVPRGATSDQPHMTCPEEVPFLGRAVSGCPLLPPAGLQRVSWDQEEQAKSPRAHTRALAPTWGKQTCLKGHFFRLWLRRPGGSCNHFSGL